jgi:hypothetical protein
MQDGDYVYSPAEQQRGRSSGSQAIDMAQMSTRLEVATGASKHLLEVSG